MHPNAQSAIAESRPASPPPSIPCAPGRCLIVVFLAMLAAPPLIQIMVEAQRGEWPRALQIFATRPTPENLRAYDKALEDASVTVRALRPWMQAAQFFALREAGEKALVGRDGWLFYQPGVGFLTQRPQKRDSTPRDAFGAVVRFRDDLAARGIRLLLLPAPNKESVYPEKLTRLAAPPGQAISRETRTFLAQCQAAGVEVLDLFALYRDARRTSAAPLYLAQDSHWTPAGMELAAEAVANRILARGWLTRGPVAYERKPASLSRLGDIAKMSRSPEIEKRIAPESVASVQIVRADNAAPYTDDPKSDVLVLGDSFLRIYQQDEPGHAGFVAHLARALGRPLASIINDGGASTLVRQELFRRPQLLAHAKVVVWEFVERDLRLGTEGWQIVPLPAPAPQATPRAD
ncbi:MAG: alginate O-acetyltransferase AlgX-related protein [Verrucomicrobiota bacterium]